MRKSLDEIRKCVPTSAGELREIPGFISAYASESGMLWSSATGKPVRVIQQGDISQLVVIYRANGKHTTRTVSSLIALAFLGEPDNDKKRVLFKDGDPFNASASNLEYGSVEEQLKQQNARGSRSGENHGMARLSEMDVIAILHFHNLGYTHTEIADWAGTTPENVSIITKRRSWTTLSKRLDALIEYRGKLWDRPMRVRRWWKRPKSE